MMDWIFYKPTFEYRKALEQNLDTFAWLGHINFAYDLVSNTKPKVIVELGTHWGVSFFSFCQAAKDNSPSTQLNAIDTWYGEEHAGVYGEEVINKVKEIKEECFNKLQIHLVRKTFDEASKSFDSHSVDLLHIDGLHTYEAVRHDFETWLPKLKKTGVVLFHDTFETGRGFGVHKFWQELAAKYPHTVQLPHSHGLGMLCFDKKLWTLIAPLQEIWKAYYGVLSEKESLARDYLLVNRELSALREELAKTTINLNEQTSVSTQLNSSLKDTARHAENLQAQLDDVRNSKAYKVVRSLGKLKRIIKRP